MPSRPARPRSVEHDRRTFLSACLSLPAARFAVRGTAEAGGSATLERLRRLWLDPPADCRPRTRWWWPGNAVTREGIDAQLRDMAAHGLGGVQIVSIWRFYERGNAAYLSPEWRALVRHALDRASALGLDVSLAFGPGWDVGGSWVPPRDRSKVLAPAWVDVDGPADIDLELPRYARPIPETGLYAYLFPIEAPPPEDHEQVVAVVAGRLEGERLLGDTLADWTPKLRDGRLRASLPSGRWRLTAFRLTYTGQRCASQDDDPPHWVVDHLDRGALERACGHLAGALRETCGPHLGRTVTSVFFDSFEVVPLPDTLLWSRDALAGFARHAGYELAPLLPALWWDAGPETPRVRYDVNEYLHRLALDGAFSVFTRTAESLGLEACIQPHYRFTEEVIEGAGRAHRPETEVTTARFATVADPRKATVAGARFYGRPVVSAEAYTFIHRERYRATLEELKIASDAFLRDGVTLFYNHGYLYSPEREVAPDRDFVAAERIQPWNPWWPHYPHLARYLARCCALLRQGRFAADVLLYSPQAQVWSETVVRNVEQRVMPYGDLPRVLLANGWDYDPVNDDVLQRRARFEGGRVRVGDQAYRVVVLPAARVMPLATAEALRAFVAAAGVVIAVGCAPGQAAGRAGAAEEAALQRTLDALFGPGRGGREHPGGGRTHVLAEYALPHVPFSPQRAPWSPSPPLGEAQARFLELLRRYAPPDLELEGARQSDGLTFQHRVADDVDLYFVTNLQPAPVDEWVAFRCRPAAPEQWDAVSGRSSRPAHRRVGETTQVQLRLAPWESAFLVFAPGSPGRTAATGERPERDPAVPPLELPGPWRLTLEGVRDPRRTLALDRLESWTRRDDTRHFSGTGTYETELDLPAGYDRDDLALVLDLGGVGHVAEAELDGAPLGVRWMQPYVLALPRTRAGRHRLTVRVTNTLIHHVTGLRAMPPIPPEVAARHGDVPRIVRRVAEAARRDQAAGDLPESGLLGPVRIRAARTRP